jgi:hypothetical protein
VSLDGISDVTPSFAEQTEAYDISQEGIKIDYR